MDDIRYNHQVSLLCKQVQAGSDAAFVQLWCQFQRFAIATANRIAVQHTADRRDLVLQACRLGIWQAAMRYDPDKGAFTTYASWWIRHSVHDALGELMTSHGFADVDQYADELPAEDADSLAASERLVALQTLADTWTPTNQQGVSLTPLMANVLGFLLEDKSQTEIAEMLGCSKQYVNQVVKQLQSAIVKVM